VVACVVYAAKSTEDRRGSIADQIRECTEAIAADPRRKVVSEYTDEGFSAYSGSRGPGLVGAISHVEELAGEGREAELWAQHSDRLARGDGRSARHAVEIALWALKRDVRVRTIQDPDTFRDLLYAVVTGQRNHEDSRRKGLATAAGMRRAAERGECIGTRPDGYMFAIEISESGIIKRRLQIDPKRRLIIETIFRLALRGKRTGEIARALNDAGGLTKSLVRSRQPRSWTCHSILSVLRNPRYAGLATLKGEVIGHGNWPAYITERQHRRIRTGLAERRPPPRYRPVECYLLARLARCGFCESPLHVLTGLERKDGTLARRYTCSSHRRDRDKGRCDALPIDADVVEAMFAAAMAVLLSDDSLSMTAESQPAAGPTGSWAQSAERQQVLAAMLTGGEEEIDQALGELLARISPDQAMVRRLAISGRRSRELEFVNRLEAWVKINTGTPSEASRKELGELRHGLHDLFAAVTLAQDATTITIQADHRTSGGKIKRNEVRFNRREWRRVAPVTLRAKHAYMHWDQAEIIGALQRWADHHGNAPRSSHWKSASVEHPSSNTVRRHLTSWPRALKLAGLVNPRPVKRWSDDEIFRALAGWTKQHGRPPRQHEWTRGTPMRPCTTTVCNHFGSWSAALLAAAL
jgi:DNA invertase Pin-like site-specific DNA recombinase